MKRLLLSLMIALAPFSLHAKKKAPPKKRPPIEKPKRATEPKKPAPPKPTQPTLSKLQTQMIRTLDYIGYIFESNYAPADWKKEHFGWSLNNEIAKAKKAVQNNPNINYADFHTIVRNFLRSTRDYHVNVWFFRTEAATLPFSVKKAGGKYFIVDIDRKKLPKTSFPFEIGDEIVTFDGLPVDAVIRGLKAKYLTSGEAISGDANEKTDQALAEIYLTRRLAALGLQEIPRGPITISCKSKWGGQERNWQLAWDYTPEKVRDNSKLLKAHPFLPTVKEKEGEKKKEEKYSLTKEQKKIQSLFPTDMTAGFWNKLSIDSIDSAKPSHQIGARKSFLPPLGKVVWESDKDSFFDAYLFQTEGRRLIGYVRIPHFVGWTADAMDFAKIITWLETRSDALVIDQLNNPGGDLFFAYTLASMLTNQSLKAPKQHMKITPAWVYLCSELMETLDFVKTDKDAKKLLGTFWAGYPVSYKTVQLLRNFCITVINNWNEGKTLTPPMHLLGIDEVTPSPIAQYSKPILLLINEKDFSCGDFFPAILQDNKRAIVLGSQTAGAGGAVKEHSFPNSLGIDCMTTTWTLAKRSNNKPLENLGVTPDLPYELSATDLQHGYQEYIYTIRKALDIILCDE